MLALLRAHLAFVAGESPPEDVHALHPEALAAPGTEFVAAHRDGCLAGVGALRELEPRHGELKSMHTAVASRGTGVGRAVLAHLLARAGDRGFTRVSLETGTSDGFAGARRLYASAGFRECDPFGDYRPSPHSAYLTLDLRPPAAAAG